MTGTPTDPDLGAIVGARYKAWGQGDLDTVVEAMAQDVTYHSGYTPEVPFHGVFTGHDGVRAFSGAVGAAVEVHAFAPHTFLTAPRTVVVLGSEDATALISGTRYRNEWVHVWTFDNATVTAIRTYNDAAAVAAVFARRTTTQETR